MNISKHLVLAYYMDVGLLTILEIEDGITIGWHRMNMHNKVRMDFGDDADFSLNITQLYSF